jgi:hypothetical protein
MIINDMFWNISFCKNTVILAENLAITQHCIDKTFWNSQSITLFDKFDTLVKMLLIFSEIISETWRRFINFLKILSNKKIQLTISESILLKQLLIRNGHIPSKYCKTSTIFWQ